MQRKYGGRFLFCTLFAVMVLTLCTVSGTVLAAGSGQEETSIADAFKLQDLSDLYSSGKLVLFGQGEADAKYSKSAGGLLVSGSKEDLENAVFTFSKPFDFSDGIIGRVNVNAMAVKGNKLKICFYLDKETAPFAEMEMKSQKREGKWATVNRSVSVYDKKITGKHTVSFRIEQEDAKDQAGFVLRSVTFAKSTVPVMYFNIDETQGSIDAMNNSPEHDTECYGEVTIEIPDGYQCEYADSKGRTDNLKTETYELDYIRGRGNSTWMTDKKPYKIKFAKKQNLFNMGKNKHWVLLADYYDPTHMRNKATYWIGQQLGMEYTPQCVYVDVVMNGEYYGSYLLSEQVRLDSERVDLDDLEETPDASVEPAITGGYLLSMCPDGSDEGLKSFTTSRGNSYQIESPAFEDYDNDAQFNYIKNYMQKTEDTIYSPDFKKDGESWTDYMDPDSAVKYYWIQEFSANGDGFISTSTYLYKKRSGKLYWGPLWDFDFVAWGNNDYDFYECESWYQKENTWFAQLFKDRVFADKIIGEWPNVRKQLQAVCKDGGKLDQYEKEIAYSMNYNADLYGNNYNEDLNSFTFDQNVQQLKQWIAKRIKWVDDNIDSLKAVYYKVTFKDGKKVISAQEVFNGDPAIFPKPGNKKGYVFGGWYFKDTNGESYPLDSTDGIYQNMTVSARWVAEKDVKPIKKIVLGYNSLNLVYIKDEGDDFNTEFIPCSVIGGSGLPGQIVWSTSDKKVIVPLEDGQIRIAGTGDAVLTAASKDGKVKASCKIHVSDTYNYDFIYDMDLNKTKINLKKGQDTVLEARLYPEGNYYTDITWICSDDTIFLEPVGNKCIVHGNKAGTAQIVAVISGDEGLITRFCTVKVGSSQKVIKPGSKVTSGKLKYEVLSMTKKGGTVELIGTSDKKLTKITIPSTISINKKNYRVVSVAGKAFAKNKKITQLTVGKNVTNIKEKAFYGCKKLKKITFKGSKTGKIGKQAFKGTASRVLLTCSKKSVKKYQKLLNKAGVKKVVTKKSSSKKKTAGK